jgi:hypothetical protein
MKSLILAIGVGLTAVSAHASELIGIGLNPCSEYTTALQAKSDNLYITWAFGFLSGVNAVNQSTGKNERDLTALVLDDERQLLGSYCGSHPSAQFLDAVIDLIKVLPRADQTLFAGHTLPAEISGAKRISIHDYETVHPGSGYSAGYRHNGAISTVYFYNAGIAKVDDDLKSPEIDLQFQRSLSDIHQAQAPGTIVTEKSKFVVSDGQARPRVNCIGLVIKETNSDAKDSYLCVGSAEGAFFKVRTTMPTAADSETEIKRFVSGWSQTLWH